MGRNKKLSAPEVLRAKEMIWEGSAQQDIALHFGVSQATISRIQRGEQWPHVRWPDGSSGPLPIEREQQIIAQRFPGVAIRGVISKALASGLSAETIAARVQQEIETREEEEEIQGITAVLEKDTGEREDMPRAKERKIPLINPSQWASFTKKFPAAWWKGVPLGDRIKQTAVYEACTAEGAVDLTGAQLRRQIDALEILLRHQHPKESRRLPDGKGLGSSLED